MECDLYKICNEEKCKEGLIKTKRHFYNGTTIGYVICQSYIPKSDLEKEATNGVAR